MKFRLWFILIITLLQAALLFAGEYNSNIKEAQKYYESEDEINNTAHDSVQDKSNNANPLNTNSFSDIPPQVYSIVSVRSWKDTEYIPDVDPHYRFRAVSYDGGYEGMPYLDVEKIGMKTAPEVYWRTRIDVTSNPLTKNEYSKLSGESAMSCCAPTNVGWDGLTLRYEIRFREKGFKCELNKLIKNNFNTYCETLPVTGDYEYQLIKYSYNRYHEKGLNSQKSVELFKKLTEWIEEYPEHEKISEANQMIGNLIDSHHIPYGMGGNFEYHKILLHYNNFLENSTGLSPEEKLVDELTEWIYKYPQHTKVKDARKLVEKLKNNNGKKPNKSFEPNRINPDNDELKKEIQNSLGVPKIEME